LVIPLLSFVHFPNFTNVPIVFLDEITIGTKAISDSFVASNQYLPIALKTIYTIGVFGFLLSILRQLLLVYQKIQGHTQQKEEGHTLVFLEENSPVFSFFHYLFLPKNFDFETPEKHLVLQHEQEHIRQRHSIDLLFISLTQAFFWFNPFIYLLKKALQSNHEYQADWACTQNEKIKTYTNLLLAHATPCVPYRISHAFNHSSQIKNRIMMLYQNRSHRLTTWKYLFIIPCLFLVLGIFSCAKEDTTLRQNTLTGKTSSSDNVFVTVEQMPEFIGGKTAMLRYIYTNIKYPQIARDEGIEGLVKISFVVDKSGKPTDFEIKEDIGGGCGEEALRVVKSMPDWIPGKQKGKAVNVQYNLPVQYKLE